MELFSFFIFEHFFQFFTLIISVIYFILIFIVKGIVVKYPELLIDGLSIFKILTYPFKNKSKMSTSHEKIDKINDKYDEYEEKYDNFIGGLFFPYPQTFFFSSILSYVIYYFGVIESSVLLNIFVIFIIFFSFKIIFKKEKKIKDKNIKKD